jgi:phage FluMu gp28-like protein
MKKDLLSEGKGSPLIVSMKDPDLEDLAKIMREVKTESDWCSIALDQDELDKNVRDGRKFEWELYQLYYMDVVGSFITNKPRQAGMSFACAAKYFATSQLTARPFTAVFVSYKKEEAISKINYVKQMLDALPLAFRKKITRDPLQMIEFENRDNGTTAKIYSHAQKPIRGVTADKVLFDEFAFFNQPNVLYESALPATIQTNGTIDIISTPFGKGGMFYDMLMFADKYPDYTRIKIEWWMCMAYLKEPNIDFMLKAKKLAPHMSTEERVEMFGSPRLKHQYRNAMSEESFMQEFEGYFIDESAAFFPKDLIYNCLYDFKEDLDKSYDVREDDFKDNEGNILNPEDILSDEFGCPLNSHMNLKGISRKEYSTFSELMTACLVTGEVTPNLLAGMDIGTTNHASELTILEEITFEDGSTFQVERYRESFHRVDLDLQTDTIEKYLQTGIIRRFNMDATGLGKQMAQTLHKRFPTIVKGVELGGSSKKKEEFFTNLKRRVLDGTIALFNDKKTIDQVYSINRTVRGTGTVVYEADEKQKHHADYAFALAFASLAGTKAGELAANTFSSKKGTASPSPVHIIMSAAGLKALSEQNKEPNQGILQKALEHQSKFGAAASTSLRKKSVLSAGSYHPLLDPYRR